MSQPFYDHSVQLNELIRRSQKLLGFNAARHRHFVDASPLRHQCTYARMSRRHALAEEEELRKELEALQQLITTLLPFHDQPQETPDL